MRCDLIRRTLLVTSLALAISGGLTGCAQGPGAAPAAAATTEPSLAWRPDARLPGVASAKGVGDPAQPGLYAMFGRMAKDSRFPPHAHPDGRLTTVIYGTMYLGLGDAFDESKVTAYPSGSVVFTPANTMHYMWAKDGTVVMQEAGSGPTGMKFQAP